ncbi:MAG: hypothetical protein EPN30_02510 [Actinomycetota bacterium]|nr:MAG: hypothetical protein EPN30_02510 [Actinomycetota bacterium]
MGAFNQPEKVVTTFRKKCAVMLSAMGLTLTSVSAVVMLTSQSAWASTDFTSFSPPLTGATDFATNFPYIGNSFGIGPIGMIDDGTNFFVSDFANGRLYKFPITGGSATTVPSAPDGLFGLALSHGSYFATNLGTTVKTFNPSTLAVSPTNVLLPCGGAEGIAADPLSTDLYVDTSCGVYRVQSPLSASPTVSLFSTSITNNQFDGISISSNGQAFWAADTQVGKAVEFNRSGAVVATVTDTNSPDGIGIAEPGVTFDGINVSNNVFINNNNGTITRVDTNNGNALSTVASGGSRGDMAITGPNGCLYVTQSDRVEQLSPCFFQAITPTVGVTPVASISGTEGSSFNGTVATITDSSQTALALGFSATINWGDGTTSSTGTVTGSAGSFTVTGSHDYAEEGSYTVSISITDPAGTVHKVTTTASVADAALTATGSPDFASANLTNQTLATFTDANASATVADFTSGGGSTIINWGDGSTSSGTVTQTGPGSFSVSGSHSYSVLGPHTITVTIVDDGGSTAIAVTHVTAFAFPSGGAFVISNANSANGTAVTFWGAQWAKINTLSGGLAPSSFKGFEDSAAPAVCSTSWTTDPGNSTPPPSGPLPTYMGVIVSSSITQSGSMISGNTPGIVIVKTNSGYAPDPGHAGTGTVVASVC